MTGNHSCNLKANLARIRDNQRRSRARRKEYLQELETKWRMCEQLGVEASAEMQQAARRVLDENRRLRALLKQRGVSDEEIEAFAVADSPSASPRSTPGSPSQAEDPASAPSAQLAQMLMTRKPVIVNCEALPQASSAIQQQQPPQLAPIIPFANMSPSTQSIVSSTVSTPTTILSRESYAGTPPTAPSSDAGDFALPSGYILSPNFDSSWQAYQSPTSATSYPDFGYTSCIDAANIIRSMRGDLGVELESDLGYTNLGTDCKVDNIAVFNVMDKFNGQPITMEH